MGKSYRWFIICNQFKDARSCHAARESSGMGNIMEWVLLQVSIERTKQRRLAGTRTTMQNKQHGVSSVDATKPQSLGDVADRSSFHRGDTPRNDIAIGVAKGSSENTTSECKNNTQQDNDIVECA
jgi:hypothetical protein